MINTRSDIYDILTDYLKKEYELIYMFYSGDDGMWSNHKVVQYANGVVLGKYREKDICTMNVLKKGVSDKALVDEIKRSIAYEDKLYRAKEKPDIMDKAHNETNQKLSRELLEFSIDEWIHRNCKWIKEDTFDISDQEERVLLFLYYAFRNFSNEGKIHTVMS